jgi:ketosteroid isomerase-like protein
MSVSRPSSALILLLIAAACTPNPVDQAVASAAVDTAAIKGALDAVRAEYMRLYAARDAAGIAALYSEAGSIDFYGAPPMRGKAGIEAGLNAGFAVQKPVSLEIISQMTVPINDARAGERGIYHTVDSLNGKAAHAWGRWVSSAGKDSTGAWRLNYLMAFPDSQKTDK